MTGWSKVWRDAKVKVGLSISAGTFAGTAPMSFPCLLKFDTGVLKMVAVPSVPSRFPVLDN